jgi:uncharacterized protein
VESVRVVYRKYDGTLHWNQLALRLGADEHGTWLGIKAGTPVFRGELATAPAETDNVLLIPRDGWWTASFNAEPHRTEIYCDITTVPRWFDGLVTMIDLDLDVRRRRTGVVELLDEDEFAMHQVQFGYPPEIVTAARSAADCLFGAVSARVEPFDVAYHTWLAKLG